MRSWYECHAQYDAIPVEILILRGKMLSWNKFLVNNQIGWG